MSAPAVFSLVAALALCIYASASDIRTERIANRVLLCALVIAVIADAALYAVIEPELFPLFAVNAAATCVFALVLFYTHTWAGGDCKLACVLAAMYPAEAYLRIGELGITLPLAIGIGFILGSVYLLAAMLAGLVRRRFRLSKDTRRSIAKSFAVFAQSYLCALAFVGALYLVNAWLVAPYVELGPIAVALAGFCCIWLLSSAGLLKNRVLLVALLAFDVVGGLLLHTVPLGASPGRYLFVLAVVLLRIVVSQHNYRTIPTSQVRRGMVLTTATSLLFAGSRVRGLPGVSTEDLRSRLTEEEAESVRRWEHSAKGRPEVEIVRSVPFAIFVSLGFLAYFALWVALP